MRKYLFLCLIPLLFISCDNFLDGSDFKDKLDSDISYANASEYEIRVDYDTACGSLITQNIFSKKKGDSFDIEFKLSEAYFFSEWKAFTRSSDGTLTELPDGYIKFAEYPESSESGLYKVKVTLLEEADNIVIKPVCFILPAVLSYSPASASDINYSNTAIVINFTSAMEPAPEDLENSPFNFENISITCDGLDYSEYFESPLYNSENKSLTINPKALEFYEKLLSINSAYVELQVSLSDKITITKEGKKLPLYLNDKASFTVRYKAEKESTPPVMYDFFVTRLEQNSLSALSFLNDEDKFSLKLEENLSKEELFQNRTNGTLYFYGNFYDEGSGVKTVRITEKLTHNAGAGLASGPEYEKTFSAKEDFIAFENDGNGYTKFIFRYDLQSEDGGILLNLTVTDACGNSVETPSFSAIKKSFINTNFLKLSNGIKAESDDLYYKYKNATDYDAEEFDSYLRSFLLKCEGELSDVTENIFILYGDFDDRVLFPDDYFSISYSYTSKDGLQGGGIFENLSEDYECFAQKTIIDEVSLDGLQLKIYLSDDMGNSAELEYELPSKDEIFATINKSESSASYTFYSNSGTINKCIKVWDNQAQYSSCSATRPLTILPGESYYLSICVDNIYCGISDNPYTYDVQTTSLAPLSFDTSAYTLSKMEKTVDWEDSYLNLKVNIVNKADYDAIRILVKTYQSTQNNRTFYSTKVNKVLNSSEELIVPVRAEYFFGNKVDVTLQGIKGFSVTEEASFEIPAISEQSSKLSLDNIIPYVSQEREYDYVLFAAIDDQSGIKNIKVTVTENGDVFESEEDTLKLPLNDYYGCHFYYEVSDNAGNIKKAPYEPFFYEGVDFISVEKINTNYVLSTKEYREGYLNTNSITSYVYSLDSDEAWTFYKEIPSSNSISLEEGAAGGIVGKRSLTCTGESSDLPANSFVKVLSKLYTGYGRPLYFYTGSAGSGKYDFLWPDGNSKSSVAISSDAPVFVHTLSTGKSYEECKNWSVSDWEFLHRDSASSLMTFSEEDHFFQKYTIPMEEIKDGECYCVIAHFADGSTAMSEVMQK